MSITNGWIHVAVNAGEAAFDLSFDDVGDSMVLLARFVQIMVAGGEPHAPLAENGCATFVVNHHGTGVCRFHLISRPHAFMPESHGGMIDMLVDRDELTEQFRALTNAIATIQISRITMSATESCPKRNTTGSTCWRRWNGKPGRRRRDFRIIGEWKTSS